MMSFGNVGVIVFGYVMLWVVFGMFGKIFKYLFKFVLLLIFWLMFDVV